MTLQHPWWLSRDAEMVEFIYRLSKYLLRSHVMPDSAVGPGNSCLQCFWTGVLEDGG